MRAASRSCPFSRTSHSRPLPCTRIPGHRDDVIKTGLGEVGGEGALWGYRRRNGFRVLRVEGLGFRVRGEEAMTVLHGLPASVLALEQPWGYGRPGNSSLRGLWGGESRASCNSAKTRASTVLGPWVGSSCGAWGPSAVCKTTLQALAVACQVPLQAAMGGSVVSESRLNSAGSTQSGRGVPGSQGRGSGYQGVSMRLQLDMSIAKSAPGQSWLAWPSVTLCSSQRSSLIIKKLSSEGHARAAA